MLFLLSVPGCRTAGGYCENQWLAFYPTDLEFREELTSATLRSGACNPPDLIESRLATVRSLDGVDPTTNLALTLDCAMDGAYLEGPRAAGEGPIRLLDLSRKKPVAVQTVFVRSEVGCGLVVRPGRMDYDRFYALYLMRRSGTAGFAEPRAFRKLKWKAFRNQIDTEADELYRDALSTAEDLWGTHPDSFLMIMAFSTRSFRQLSVPAIGNRNAYMAGSRRPRLLDSLSESRHILSNFLLDYDEGATSRIQDHMNADGPQATSDPADPMEPDRSAGLTPGDESSPRTASPRTSDEQNRAGIDPLAEERYFGALRRLRFLARVLGMNLKFAEISGACTSLPEKELCNFEEVELEGLNPRYIPLFLPRSINGYNRFMVLQLSDLHNEGDLNAMRSLLQRLQKQSVAPIILAGPLPQKDSRYPDHIQKQLLHAAAAIDALPYSLKDGAFFCGEPVYCPMAALYSRRIGTLISVSRLGPPTERVSNSFPVHQYRERQVRAALMRSFQFQSYFGHLDRTLDALRKDRFDILYSGSPYWPQ